MLYIVRWVSPHGFANEGEYLYGERKAVLGDPDGQRAQVRTIISRHHTLDAARRRAQKEWSISRRRIAWGEQSYDSIREIS